MLRFQNDYSEGAHPNVLRALCDTNLSSTPGYGLDDDCRRAADAIRARFACPDADVHFLVGGTQTNQLAAAAFLRPWEAMVAADTGHVNVHETGAIEATGHKVIAMPGTDGKLTPAAIADAAAQHCAAPGVYDEHMVLPRMAYISDSTELGTVYTKAELTALRAACDAHGLYLYLDGARLAQALTAAGNDLQPEDLPRLCDAFYIGGTKNGLLFGEAMVIVNDALKPGFRRAMKRNGAMLAKGRLLGVQFAAAMAHDLWLDMGRHADAQAQRIAAALTDRNVPMYVPSPTNQIFPSCRTRRSRGCRSRSRSHDRPRGRRAPGRAVRDLVGHDGRAGRRAAGRAGAGAGLNTQHRNMETRPTHPRRRVYIINVPSASSHSGGDTSAAWAPSCG
ncbi:MAG: threonine aldolase family protein [Oscillospiraceae bacterium]